MTLCGCGCGRRSEIIRWAESHLPLSRPPHSIHNPAHRRGGRPPQPPAAGQLLQVQQIRPQQIVNLGSRVYVEDRQCTVENIVETKI